MDIREYNEILSYSKAFNSNSGIEGDQCLPFKSCFSVSDTKKKISSTEMVWEKKKKYVFLSHERFSVKENVLCFIINF